MHRHGGDIYRNQNKIDYSANINFLGMPQAVRQDFTSRTTPDFPAIRCGIRPLTQVQATQWESEPVQR